MCVCVLLLLLFVNSKASFYVWCVFFCDKLVIQGIILAVMRGGILFLGPALHRDQKRTRLLHSCRIDQTAADFYLLHCKLLDQTAMDCLPARNYQSTFKNIFISLLFFFFFPLSLSLSLSFFFFFLFFSFLFSWPLRCLNIQ